jgi:hypothetical protein
MRPRRLLALLAAATAAGLLAGCGGAPAAAPSGLPTTAPNAADAVDAVDGQFYRPEALRFAAISGADEESSATRYEPIVELLSTELGVPVEFVETTDYSSVIEDAGGHGPPKVMRGGRTRGTWALGRWWLRAWPTRWPATTPHPRCSRPRSASRADGVVALPAAVRLVTSEAAATAGVTDRGMPRAGRPRGPGAGGRLRAVAPGAPGAAGALTASPEPGPGCQESHVAGGYRR